MLFLPLSPEQTLPPSWAARLSMSSLQHSDMCDFPRGLSAEIRRGSVRLPRWEMGQISSRLESDISKYFLNRWLGQWGQRSPIITKFLVAQGHRTYIGKCILTTSCLQNLQMFKNFISSSVFWKTCSISSLSWSSKLRFCWIFFIYFILILLFLTCKNTLLS